MVKTGHRKRGTCLHSFALLR